MGRLTPKRLGQVAEKPPSDYAEGRKMFKVFGVGSLKKLNGARPAFFVVAFLP